MRSIAFATLLVLSGCRKEAPPAAAPPPAAARPAAAAATGNVIALEVTADGFVPGNLKVKAGEPLTLNVTRKTDETCATELLIDGTDINVPLPLFKTVTINWTPSAPGSVKFGCAMDKMIGGVLLVE